MSMKKRNLILAVLLPALTAAGVWGISLLIRQDLNTDIRLAPSAPRLSVESGFYPEEFELTIQAEDGADIYYTLDGSVPTLDSLRYEGPVTISAATGSFQVPNVTMNWSAEESTVHPRAATVLRAAVIDPDGRAGDCVTATYFVGDFEKRQTIVVSIAASPDDLFGDNGIYVTGKEYDEWYLGGREGAAPVPNFLKHGREWERPAVIEFFCNQESVLQQPVGIRIQGASMREEAYKRFSIYARKEYSGSSWFDIPVFGEKRSHAVMLRSGFMNGYIQHLVQDRDVASADSAEVFVYLNGAPWYITILQEKYTEKYFQEHYGVDDDNVIIAKAGLVESGDAGDQILYQAMYDFLNTHDMSQDEAYGQLDRLMDIQSYIDFSCVNVYFANLDFNEEKNVVCWRAREYSTGEYGDGRWRWGLYDMDLENLDYGYYMEDINTFTQDTHYAGAAFHTRPMWAALMKNGIFRRQFVLSFMDMVNTDFSVERARKAMEGWVYNPLDWGMKADWVESFFPARTKAVTGYLAEEFGLTGTQEQVTLSVSDPEDGYIVLNTITPDLENGSWSGMYFTDYPVTVTAVAKDGHRFVGWECGEIVLAQPDNAAMTLEIPKGGLTLSAVFE